MKYQKWKGTTIGEVEVGRFQARVKIKCDGWGGEAETNATSFILIDPRQFSKIIKDQ